MRRLLEAFPESMWIWISRPRVLNTLVAFAWISVAVAGVISFIYPPNIVQDGIGAKMTVVMGSMAFLGGLLGFMGALTGLWFNWLERAGAYFCITAGVLYMWPLTFANDFASPWFHFFLVLAGMFVIVGRLLLINYLMSQPFHIGREAGNG